MIENILLEKNSEDTEYKERCLVLRHLLRQRSLLAAAYPELIRTRPFSDYRDLQCIWELAELYFHKYHGCITFEVLRNDLENCYLEQGFTAADLRRMLFVLEAWYSTTEFSSDFIQDLLRDYFKSFTAGNLALSLEYKPVEEATEDIATAHKILSKDPFQQVVSVNPFDDPNRYLFQKKRISSGVSFIDFALDGGGRPGELIGVIAPSSGGKTTLGLQIAAHQVRNKRYVIYESFEQELAGDITSRIFALSAGTTREIFDSGNEGGIPADIREELDRVKPIWKEYFHLFELNVPGLDIADVSTILSFYEQLAAQQKKADYLIIDWWGSAFRKMAASSSARSDTQTRMFSKECLNDLKAYAQKHQIVIVLLHQVSGQAAAKSFKHRPSSYEAQEDRTFNNQTDFCFALGKKDGLDMVQVVLDKARSRGYFEGKYLLDGAHCLFRDENHMNAKSETMIEPLTEISPYD